MHTDSTSTLARDLRKLQGMQRALMLELERVIARLEADEAWRHSAIQSYVNVYEQERKS
jgi:hypothetical protein